MNTHLYTCKHCFKEFLPTRRGVQKFCSASCRASHHQCNSRKAQKENNSLILNNEITEKVVKLKKKGKKKGKEEGLNIPGIGNAALGTVLADTAKHMLTPEHNKPVTKGDLSKLVNNLKGYHRIKNLQPNILGYLPYLEVETGNLVYLSKESLKLK